MSADVTMVFIDLAGSTAAFAAVGNARAADVVSKLTQWIARVVEAHAGRTVKFLGDGVMAQFGSGTEAVEAAVFMQQNHSERLQKWPEPLRMPLKIGMAAGPVVSKADDVFGDAVNLAARLADMAGAGGVWADEGVIGELRRARSGAGSEAPAGAAGSPALEAARFRALGMIRVRGLAEPRAVFQIEWSHDVSSDLMTVRGSLPDEGGAAARDGGSIVLAWLGESKVFAAADLPTVIGRVPGSGFVVSDQRVSRSHARVELIDGAFVLTDLSSFGTWVRFADSAGAEVQLRRTQCVLHATGEIALGAPFSDFSAVVIAFRVGVGA